MTVLRLLNLLLAGCLVWLVVQKIEKSSSPVSGFSSVIGKVNGRPIYAHDLLSAAQIDGKMPDQNRLQLAWKNQIQLELASEKARDVSVPNEELERQLQLVRDQFDDGDRAKNAQISSGLTDAELRRRFERNLKAEHWLRTAAHCEPTDAECRAWFAANPEISQFPEAVEATHFAAIFPPNGTPLEFLEKGDLIRNAQSRLADGIPFPQLIEALSDDPAKKLTHGSLGWFGRTRLEPAIIEAAFHQPLQQIGPPVETRFGFHLIQVSQRNPASTLTYEQVADEVRQRCRDEQERKKIESLMADFVQHAKIEIFDPRFQKP